MFVAVPSLFQEQLCFQFSDNPFDLIELYVGFANPIAHLSIFKSANRYYPSFKEYRPMNDGARCKIQVDMDEQVVLFPFFFFPPLHSKAVFCNSTIQVVFTEA